MSLLEITQEIAQLTPEERRQLRARLDLIESLSAPEVMERLTASNRQAAAGKVHTREEVIAALEKAGTKVL